LSAKRNRRVDSQLHKGVSYLWTRNRGRTKNLLVFLLTVPTARGLFETIKIFWIEIGLSILLVEQNIKKVIDLANRTYVL